MAQRVSVGIDIGGTLTKVGLIDQNGRVLAREKMPTEPEGGAEKLVNRIADAAGRLVEQTGVQRDELQAVGAGSPGPLNLAQGRIIRAANLRGWEDVPLRDLLSNAFDRPAALDNDANAACWGEFWVGAGREVNNVAVLTLGTGIGGGVVLEGELVHGHFDNAGELGHLIIMAGGRKCACGQHGCFEAYASATTMARRAAEELSQHPQSRLHSMVGAGERLNSRHIVEAAQGGDEFAVGFWRQTCEYLAVGMISIQHAFNVERIILGGGLSDAGQFLLDHVQESFDRNWWRLHDDAPQIVLAKLGQDAGLIGAAGLAINAATGS